MCSWVVSGVTRGNQGQELGTYCILKGVSVNACLNCNTGTVESFVELCSGVAGLSAENCYVAHFRGAEVRDVTNLGCAIAQLCSLAHF